MIKLDRLKYFIKNPYNLFGWLRKQKTLWQLKRCDNFAWIIEMWRYRGLRMGNNCLIFGSVDILSEPFLVEIGSNVIITGGVKLLTHDGGPMIFRDEIGEKEMYGTIKIGNNVFIGMCSIILPNVIIGDDVIIGAGSVVRRNIPSNCIVAGNPAEVIMKTDVAKRFILKNRNLLERTSMMGEIEAIELLFDHFRLNCDNYDTTFKHWDHLHHRKLNQLGMKY